MTSMFADVLPDPGDRIRFLSSSDPYSRLQPGTEGTFRRVDGVGTLHVAWDDGSTLGLVPGEDRWEVIP